MPPRDQRNNVIFNLHLMGRSYGQIARSSGLSRVRIRQIILREWDRRSVDSACWRG